MGAVLSVMSSVSIVLVFAILFCLIGKTALGRIGLDHQNASYVLAESFFIGMAIYLSVLRTLALAVPSYKIVFWALLIAGIVFFVFDIFKGHVLWNGKWRKPMAVVAGFWAVFTFHALLYRLCAVGENPHMYTNIGTIGSQRYADIAAYFVRLDHIPVLNQSYGQSLLASFSGMLGRDNLCFALVLWLSISGVFLCLLLYGVFRRFFSAGLSVLLVCVVDVGSVSLTLAPIRVVDSDYPLLFSGYTDSVAGVATFMVLLEMMVHLLKKEEESKLSFSHYLVTACCVIYWAMSAPHNICILLGAGFLLLVFLLVRKERSNAAKGAKLACAVIAACLIGILEGGMLTPSGLVDEVPVDGVMTVTEGADGSQSKQGIVLAPVMNYQLTKGPDELWQLGWGYMQTMMDYAVDGLHQGKWYVLFHGLASLWWDSIRIIFWPLLGVLGMGLIAYRQRSSRELSYWAVVGFGVMAVGYPVAFLISLNGYKWALSRFAMPFYFLGMLFLAMILGRAWKSDQKLYRLASLFSVFAILISQIGDKLLIYYHNASQNDVWAAMRDMMLFTGS